MMTTIRMLTLAECCEKLREYGIKISQETLALGLEQGAFPFGFVIKGLERRPYIFEKQVEEWLLERCDPVSMGG